MYVIMDKEFERVQIEHEYLPCVMSGKGNFRGEVVEYKNLYKALIVKIIYWDVNIVPLKLFQKLQNVGE